MRANEFFRYFKPLDWLIIGAVCLVILGLTAITLGKNSGTPAYLKVTAAGTVYMYDLANEQIIEVPGKIGKTQIEIKGGAARVLFSPCPTKTCMAKPAISRVGEWIACLPNEVFLQIESDEAETTIVY